MTLTSADLGAFFLGLEPEQLAKRAQGGGAYGDLFVEDHSASAVRLEGGAIVRAARDRGRGYAVRSLSSDGRTRIASSTDLDPQGALRLAAEIAFPGTAPSPARVDDRRAVFRSEATIRPESIDFEQRIAWAQLADRIARGRSPAIREVSVTVRDSIRRTGVAGSDGRIVAQEHLRAMIAVEAVAGDGEKTQSAFEAVGGVGGVELLSEEAIERCATLAAERAVRMLFAKPAPAGEMTVVLAAEAGGTFVHEAVGHSLEADLVLEGLSALGDRIGDRVASEKITVLDDATIFQKNGTYFLDDEGVFGEQTKIIDRGVLVSLLYDQRTAMMLGAKSSGKGRRESFRDRPIVRMTNTMIAPGTDDPAAILRNTPSGLYVVRMGGGEVDTITGQFVFEVSEAHLIENGKIGEPVRGATLAGDCLEVLASIDRVGNDLGFGVGICGKDGQDVPISDAEPTIRIPALVVGGA